MQNELRHLTLGLALIVGAGSAAAQSVGKVEDQIRWRQAAYHTMAWSMARIKANVEGTYNKEQVEQAANVLAALAASGMGSLYQPGSDHGKGFKETRLKSEFFKQGDKVREVAMAFGKEASELAKVAATGDVAAVKTQFGKVGETCKSCHDKYRKDEK